MLSVTEAIIIVLPRDLGDFERSGAYVMDDAYRFVNTATLTSLLHWAWPGLGMALSLPQDISSSKIIREREIIDRLTASRSTAPIEQWA